MATRTSIATDNFNRANANLGANWLDSNPSYSDLDIVSNQIQGSSDVSEAAYWAGTGTFTDDQYSKLKITSLNFNSNQFHIGVCARGTGQNGSRTYYGFRVLHDSGGPGYTTELFKVVNGTDTVLATGQVNWSVNDTVEIEVIGTTITGFKNGSAVSGFSVTDATITTGKPGPVALRNACTGDDWEGGSLTTGTPGNASGAGVSVTASAPSGSASSINATITDRLIDLTGSVLANLTGLTALIYKTIPSTAVAPSKVIPSVTTNGSGNLSLNVSDIGLASGDPVFLILLKDGSPAKCTARKVTPTYS